MAKYHIFEIQVKKADYRSLVSPQMMARFHMNYTQFVNSYRIGGLCKPPVFLCFILQI